MKTNKEIDEINETKTELGKLITTFQGTKMPQATFVYGELFLKEFEKLNFEEKENNKKLGQELELELEKNKFNYEAISVISKGNKIYYYTLDARGARQVNEFSTFHFKEDEKMILSSDGRYFMIQNTDKILHLYNTRNKTLLKSLRTHEHQPFLGNAYFDLENNEIVALTKMGESRWSIGD